MATIAPMNPTQLAAINAYQTAGNWPDMYKYIAKGIENGVAAAKGLPVTDTSNIITIPGGTDSKMYFWYSKAPEVNANDPNSPAAAFIRDVAYRGMQYGTNGNRCESSNRPWLDLRRRQLSPRPGHFHIHIKR